MKYNSILKVACLCFGLLAGSVCMGQTEKSYLNIIFIGNSITAGALLDSPRHDAPPAKAAIYLGKQPAVKSVKYSNQGVSGCTTVDYLPRTETLFPQMTEAADNFRDETWATLVFSIMLGTNDSAITGTNGAPVSPAQYYENMKTIIDRLLASYPSCKVVVHRPVWYSPNTYNGAQYLEEGLARLQSYYPELEALVTDYAKRFPEQVFMGDTAGFDYFRKNHATDCFPEKGNAGVFYLHPNKKGAAVLGELWGKAILKALQL